jgi:nucleoid DNA-binding protein
MTVVRPVPEPSTYILMGFGLFGTFAVARRRPRHGRRSAPGVAFA